MPIATVHELIVIGVPSFALGFTASTFIFVLCVRYEEKRREKERK